MRTTAASTKTPSAYGTTYSAAPRPTIPTATGSGSSCSPASKSAERRAGGNGPRRNAAGCRYCARRQPSPAGVVVTLFAVRPDLSRTPVPARQEFCAFGGKSLAHLTDGSTVWLQSGSTLAYDSSFGAESRNVKLRGEGFFDIAKDPERPFTVEVEGLRIRVHGTKFNVNTSHEDRTVAVSLVEGSVALDSGNGETRRLHPGEIACYDPATQELNIRRGNVELESCWAAGKLVLRAAVAGRNLPLPLTLVRPSDRHLPGTRPQLRLHVHPHRRTARSDSAHHEPHQSDRLHLLGQPLGVHLRDRIKP